MTAHFLHVTELAGEDASQEQVFRVANRYYWAGDYCAGKDVIEIACGSGPGLGYLAGTARSLKAGDISPEILEIARQHYGERIPLDVVDGQKMPYADNSADSILIFEALYYIADLTQFMREVKRVLRPGGSFLVSTANKDLVDFQPSPHSHRYLGVAELTEICRQHGFQPEFYGSTSTRTVNLRQRVLRPVKRLVVRLNLMPKSMAGKRLLKRFVFGDLVKMPAEVDAGSAERETPRPLPAGVPDREFKVVYCAARLIDGD